MPKRQIIQNIADKIPLTVLVLLIIFSGSFFAKEKTLAYCADQCVWGSYYCYTDQNYQICGDYNYDGCSEWGGRFQYCPFGTTCTPSGCITPCYDECSYAGQKQCYSDYSFQICQDTGGCLQWSEVQSCPYYAEVCGGAGCQPSEIPETGCNLGECYLNCTPSPSCCTNECSTYGSKQCADTGNWQTCEYDTNGFCLVWSNPISCPSGQACSSGNCVATCTNECSPYGSTRCSGTSKQTCGNYDADSCYEWSTLQSCAGNTSCGYGTCSDNQKPSWTCQSGSCVYSCVSDSSCGGSCANECTSGQTQCSGTSRQTCGNYDADSCYEWSSLQSCTGNTSCGYGTCLSTQKPSWTCQSGACVYSCVNDSSCGGGGCTNDCAFGSTQCSGTSKQTCGNYDADSCYEWSSNQSCTGNTSCGYGTCQSTQKPSWTCQSGACVYSCVSDSSCGTTSSCINECSQRYQTRCSSTTSIQICGIYYDSDPCLEWYSPKSCTGDTSCGYGTCQDDEKPYWSCKNNECVYECSKEATCIKEYVQNYEKKCSDNDLYWFDSNELRQDKIQECEDDNPDTGDTCKEGQCVHDNSYCDTGEHCGDNICNCQETTYTCFKDCEFVNLAVSVLAKKSPDQNWEGSIGLSPEDEIDVLVVVVNNSERDFDNIVVKTQLPQEIIYKGELKIDDAVYGDNISDGVNIGPLSSGSEKKITFKAQVSPKAMAGQEDKIVGRIEGEGVFGSDSADVTIKESSAKTAGVSVFKWIITRWYIWAIILLLLGILLYRFLKRNVA